MHRGGGGGVNQAATKKSIRVTLSQLPPLLILSLSPLSLYLCAAAAAAAAVGGGREWEGWEKMKYLLFILVVHRYACRTRDPFSQ